MTDYSATPGNPVNNLTVTGPGALYVYAGGAASGITLIASNINSAYPSPASEYVYAGGTVNGTLNEFSNEYVYGTVSNITLINGTEYIYAGGTATGTGTADGFQYVYSGGTANNAVFVLAGYQYVTGGTANNTSLSGGSEFVSSGGIANGTMLSTTGHQYVSSSGTANATIISGEGVQEVDSGGTAYGTIINAVIPGYSFGQILLGGTAYRTIVNNGGVETAGAGGIAIRTEINIGGKELISAGGASINTRIAGGVLEVAAGGNVTRGIHFSGSGGELILDSATMPATTITGFVPGDSIRLAGVIYNASDSVSVKKPGVVSISAGGAKYNLHIAGARPGETDFNFGPGSILTRTAAQGCTDDPSTASINTPGAITSPPMTFLSPQAVTQSIITDKADQGFPQTPDQYSSFQPAAWASSAAGSGAWHDTADSSNGFSPQLTSLISDLLKKTIFGGVLTSNTPHSG